MLVPGLAGPVAYPLDVSVILEAIKRLGADDACHSTDGRVQLLHSRLAIMDVAGGAQPRG